MFVTDESIAQDKGGFDEQDNRDNGANQYGLKGKLSSGRQTAVDDGASVCRSAVIVVHTTGGELSFGNQLDTVGDYEAVCVWWGSSSWKEEPENDGKEYGKTPEEIADARNQRIVREQVMPKVIHIQEHGSKYELSDVNVYRNSGQFKYL